MSIFVERPRRHRRLAPPAVTAVRGVVPSPDASPDGADVETVAPGELITATWGVSVAADLAELWSDHTALTGRAINTTAPLAGGGDLTANRTLTVADFTASSRGTVPGSGGSSDVYLRGDGVWGPMPSKGREPVSLRDTAAAIVVALADENTMIIGAFATDMTCALPSNATTPFAIGSEIDFLNTVTTGTIIFSAGAGATVNGTPGLRLRAKFSVATAKKISVDGWVIIGDLAS